MLVHFIVGEFEFFERDHLFLELFPAEGRVRVHVKTRWQRRVSFTGYQPRTAVIRVSELMRIKTV